MPHKQDIVVNQVTLFPKKLKIYEKMVLAVLIEAKQAEYDNIG